MEMPSGWRSSEPTPVIYLAFDRMARRMSRKRVPAISGIAAEQA